MRHYIVLFQIAPGEWQEVTQVRSWSKRSALKKIEKAGSRLGAYVAVPLAEWSIMEIPA